MCQTDNPTRWMKCPDEAHRPSSNAAELLDNLNAKDSEQKFCCGDPKNRFCCSFAEKVRELPGFDPGTHVDSSIRYRFHHGQNHFGFWSYLFAFVITALLVGAITYIFGCVIFEVSTLIIVYKQHCKLATSRLFSTVAYFCLKISYSRCLFFSKKMTFFGQIAKKYFTL